jgi:hypothetical protein
MSSSPPYVVVLITWERLVEIPGIEDLDVHTVRSQRRHSGRRRTWEETMNTSRKHKRLARRLAGATAGFALIAVGAIGAQSFADGGEEGAGGPPPPPGQPVYEEAPESDAPIGGGDNTLIQASGNTFDETILTKFIPASAFDPYQGDPADNQADSVQADGQACLSPDGIAGSGLVLELSAPVELPDGARIKNVTFYGTDNDPATDISVALVREEFTSMLTIFPLEPTYTRVGTIVPNGSFSTAGASETTVLRSVDNLEELVGTPSSGNLVSLTFPHRFHTVEVNMRNSAGDLHKLCGVEVQYQVAKSAADPGTVFHPIDPVRVFDSRQASFPAAGLLSPNTSKVVSIANGFDNAGVAIPAQANAVPEGATAITYNLTAAGATGPNFVSVTAGDAVGYTASSLNYNAGSNVANAATVTIAADRTIKLWGGDNTGSTNVIIDVTGYFAPAPPVANMAS